MKIARIIALVLAILNLLLLPWWLLDAAFDVKEMECNQFTEAQQAMICHALKFELAPGETLSTKYYPGLIQSPPMVTVTVLGVKSESDFLARLHTEAIPKQESSYDIDLFTPEKPIKDYGCALTFEENRAEIFVAGYIPELTAVYKLLGKSRPFGSTDRRLMISIALEFTLILFLIFTRPKKEKSHAG